MPAPCPHRTSLPKSKRAAVLVLVYEKGGVLRVLLTTRAKTLRTHPGQTALPGGKMDEADQDITDTAVSAPAFVAPESQASGDTPTFIASRSVRRSRPSQDRPCGPYTLCTPAFHCMD